MLALAAAAGVGVARLVSPLRRIATAAAAVSEGDLSTPAGPRSTHGEIRMLADVFDRMLDRPVADMLTLASAEAGQLVEPARSTSASLSRTNRRDLPLFGQRDFHLQAVEGTLQAGSQLSR
jgi:methyl-accepting chemotaxis protein